MWNIICMILLSYSIPLSTAEWAYDLTFYDFEASDINHEYVSDFEAYVNNDNSGFLINFTIIKRFPDTTRLSYDLLGSSMGEFVIKTGLNIDVELCEVFEPNYRIVGDQIEQIGIDGDNCPPALGTYGAENLGLTPENLPDIFPPNNYLGILKFYSEFQNIVVFKAYARLAM